MVSLEKDLTIFGGLEGMQDVKQEGDTLTFWISKMYPNYQTNCTVKLQRKENSLGAVSYTFIFSYDHIDNGLTKYRRSVKRYAETPLVNDIISYARNIIA